MKTVWIVLGVLGVLALACCGGMFFLGKGLFNAVATTNNEADAYSAKIFPEIAQSWSLDVVRRESSKEFLEQIPEASLKQVLDTYKAKLGAYKSVGEFTASNTQAKTTNGDSFVVVTTNANAEFANGTAKVQLEVIKRDDSWKLLSIELQSDALKN